VVKAMVDNPLLVIGVTASRRAVIGCGIIRHAAAHDWSI